VSAPRLGWWAQLVECSAFDEDIRAAVLAYWGAGLSGSAIGEVVWLADHPQPAVVMMYGTAEDIPPDFDEMAQVVQPHMDDHQYFAFVFMKDTLLATGGLECIVISKHSVIRLNGRLMISAAVDIALRGDAEWVRSTENLEGTRG